MLQHSRQLVHLTVQGKGQLLNQIKVRHERQGTKDKVKQGKGKAMPDQVRQLWRQKAKMGKIR